jgi:hypothetical protein
MRIVSNPPRDERELLLFDKNGDSKTVSSIPERYWKNFQLSLSDSQS